MPKSLVYRIIATVYAITAVPRTMKAIMAKSALTDENIDWYVYHQANMYTLEHLAKRSNIPKDKMIIDVETIGNTVSASIPIALYRGIKAGRIQSGHRLLLVGFGVGYSWAVCDMIWEE